MSRETINTNNSLWLDENQACSLLGLKPDTLRKKCRAGEYIFKIVKKSKTSEYKVLLSSLPELYQSKYQSKFLKTSEFDPNVYNDAPDWAKRQAEKYVTIIKRSEGLRGKELKAFINEWNKVNPEFRTSYARVNDARLKYYTGGISALLAQYGKTAGTTVVKDNHFEYFKSLYLKEGAPSLYTSWFYTLGYAVRVDGIIKEAFPSRFSFKRRLLQEIPEQSIYLARYGEAKWNRKYSNYIDRDYSGIRCGSVWTSDHAQLDVACEIEDGRVVFPWITAWRDFKGGKWLSWILQSDNPNSDHIFQTFYYAADEYGIPEDIIIDNGKDYRAKDFAGGRKVHKISVDEVKTHSMLDNLGVKAHFALPYNAQTKTIERDFLKIKELFSKHMQGYRGGNVTERPEKLKIEIKQGKILKFSELKEIFNDFIENVFNKYPSNGKILQGRSPGELWAEEFTEKRVVSKDALKLFCTRTSKTFSITRNGVKDSELGITYWADWMIGVKGEKVYLRRDIKNYNEAWIFKADNDEFIGKAQVSELVPALASTEIEKSEFKEAMAVKKRNKKIAKAYAKTQETDVNDRMLNLKAAVGDKEYKAEPKVSKIANTKMDKVIRKQNDIEKIGTYDLSGFVDKKPEKRKIYLFESDKELDELAMGAGYGS